MTEIGYSLSSEEFSPMKLVECARAAEAAGFGFSLISDHFHPWTEEQPSSPFVWTVIGAISMATKGLRLGTGVTCPTMRINPAIIAQASATAAVMMGGRFFLGVGTGEYLNEHITGRHWPPASERLEMLQEAIEIIRLLWKGGWQSHHGKYFVVEDARIYTLPAKPPRIMMAASKPRSAEMAGQIADGLISFEPKSDLVRRFESTGGSGKPRYGQLTVCYAPSRQEAQRIVRKHWPNAGIGGSLMTDLALPTQFDEIVSLIRPETITEGMPLGPEPDDHLAGIKEFIDAGFDHVYVHQVGPHQREFFSFYADKILPRFGLKLRGEPAREDNRDDAR